MNKWVKSLTAMALASSLLMVGCSKGEDKKKEDDTTTQQEDKKDKETSGTEKSTDSKEIMNNRASSFMRGSFLL